MTSRRLSLIEPLAIGPLRLSRRLANYYIDRRLNVIVAIAIVFLSRIALFSRIVLNLKNISSVAFFSYLAI